MFPQPVLKGDSMIRKLQEWPVRPVQSWSDVDSGLYSRVFYIRRQIWSGRITLNTKVQGLKASMGQPKHFFVVSGSALPSPQYEKNNFI